MQSRELANGDVVLKIGAGEVQMMMLHAAEKMGPGSFADEIFQLLKDVTFANVIPIKVTREIPEITAQAQVTRERFPEGRAGDVAHEISIAISHRLNDIIERFYNANPLELTDITGKPN